MSDATPTPRCFSRCCSSAVEALMTRASRTPICAGCSGNRAPSNQPPPPSPRSTEETDGKIQRGPTMKAPKTRFARWATALFATLVACATSSRAPVASPTPTPQAAAPSPPRAVRSPSPARVESVQIPMKPRSSDGAPSDHCKRRLPHAGVDRRDRAPGGREANGAVSRALARCRIRVTHASNTSPNIFNASPPMAVQNHHVRVVVSWTAIGTVAYRS